LNYLYGTAIFISTKLSSVWLIDLFMVMKEGEVMAIHVQFKERD